MFLDTKEIKKMLYTSISVSNKTLYMRNIKVAENMEIEITYTDKYYNDDYEVYKITVTPNGIKRELIGDEIYWTSYNNKNNSDTFLVLKDGVIVKEEEEDKEEKEEKEYVEDIEDEEYYNSEANEIMSSSSIEEESINLNVKRTTGFLVFASENKNDKTNLTIINLGHVDSSIIDAEKMRELGEMWQKLSEEQQINYSKRAQLINKQYAEFVEVNLE